MTAQPTDPVINLQSTVRRIPDQLSADLEGDTALLNIETGNYYCLNETSSRIWELLEEPLTVQKLCDTLTEDFEIEPEDCQSEVIGHLVQLREEKLVEVTEEAQLEQPGEE